MRTQRYDASQFAIPEHTPAPEVKQEMIVSNPSTEAPSAPQVPAAEVEDILETPEQERYKDASKFLNTFFKPTDTICLWLIHQTKKQDWRTLPLEQINVETFRSLDQKQAEGWNVYVAMNPLKAGSTRRLKENVAEIRSAYLDIDKNGPVQLAEVNKAVEAGEIPAPRTVVQSSPNKYHIGWALADATQEQQEELLRQLIARFGGDPAASDCTRVLRLPGFKNLKYESKPLVFILKANGGFATLANFKIGGTNVQTTFKNIDYTVDGPPIPYGQHDSTLTEICGKIHREHPEKVIQELMEDLTAICERRCANHGPDYQQMCEKIAKSIGRRVDKPDPKPTIGGVEVGENPLPKQEQPTEHPLDFEIDDRETAPRPVFPVWAIEGTTLYEGFVRPTVEKSSKHPEFLFVPAVQVMLNYLSGKVRIKNSNIGLNLYVGLVAPFGKYFKSTSAELAHMYFKEAGICRPYNTNIRNSEGKVLTMQAGSSEGFCVAMQRANCRNGIAFYDEFSKLIAKVGIESSSFSSDLLQWYESGEIGNTVLTSRNSYSFEAGSYCFGWLFCCTEREFDRLWPRIAGTASGMEDRMFLVCGPEKPRNLVRALTVDYTKSAATTLEAINKAMTQEVYDYDSYPEIQSVLKELEDPRAAELVQKLALYFAIDLQKQVIDSDCIKRAKALSRYRTECLKFLDPIEAENDDARIQQEIIRELRRNRGKITKTGLRENLNASRFGTFRYRNAVRGLADERIIGFFTEPGKHGQTKQMVGLRRNRAEEDCS